MTDELKPVKCGCGGEAWTDYIIGEPSEGAGWFVCCKNCEIQTPAEYPTEAEAVQAWNRAMGGTWQKLAQTWHAYQVGENWYCENCGQQLTPYDWEGSDHE